jgi:hypothetical protein
MAQAEAITTAIRELMSRGRLSKSTNPVRAAHAELITALAGNIPHLNDAGTKAGDLDRRADHLEKVFAGLHAYLGVIIGDTAQNIPGGTLNSLYLDALFEDLAADAVGAIRKAAQQIRVNERWRG